VGKVHGNNEGAFVIWGESFSLPIFHELEGAINAPESTVKKVNMGFSLTCYNKGLFNISYGSHIVESSTLLTESDKTAVSTCFSNSSDAVSGSFSYTGSVETSNVTLRNTLLGASTALSDSTSVSIRLVTCVVIGPPAYLAAATDKFRCRVLEIADENRTVPLNSFTIQ